MRGLKAVNEEGSIVTVDCQLVPEGEFVPEPLFDGVALHGTDSTSLKFVLGQGNYLPGLHNLVQDLSVGETVRDVSLDAGWGARNDQLVATMKFADAGIEKDALTVGVQVFLANGVKCTVTDVTDDTFTIDANPPLAGASYLATVTLQTVEKGPGWPAYGDLAEDSKYHVCYFGLGCFWGGELELMRQPGVVGTAVGYAQGAVENPSYEQVCSGTTGHTETIGVIYDPDVVSYDKLVHLAMDRLGENKYLPNQVGNDKGTQYRHGVYFVTEEQGSVAKEIVQSFGEDCVTECEPATKFWIAEDYHQQYLLKGGQSARKGDKSVIRCYG